jgi:hypothetical protein
MVEQALRDADRSFTVEELAKLVYPNAVEIEKKHRVAVLRTFANIDKRMLVWCFETYCAPWRMILTNGNSVRSYVHGLLRASWWNAERSLEQIEKMLNDPEIQAVMQPGGLWWANVEINKTEREWKPFKKAGVAAGWVEQFSPGSYALTDDMPPEAREIYNRLSELYRYSHHLERDDPYLHILLGQFEPPGTPVFEYAMKHRSLSPLRNGANMMNIHQGGGQ